MIENIKHKASYIDGALRTIALFCDDVDFVASYGAIDFGKCSDEQTILFNGFRRISPDTQISGIKSVKWEQCLKGLFVRWVLPYVNVRTNKLISQGDGTDDLFDFICEAIEDDRVSAEITAKHFSIEGSIWDSGAEGLLILDGVDCYALYFMSSD